MEVDSQQQQRSDAPPAEQASASSAKKLGGLEQHRGDRATGGDAEAVTVAVMSDLDGSSLNANFGVSGGDDPAATILYPELVSAKDTTLQQLDQMMTEKTALGYYRHHRLEQCYLESVLGWDYTNLIKVLVGAIFAFLAFFASARITGTNTVLAEGIYLSAIGINLALILALFLVQWRLKKVLRRIRAGEEGALGATVGLATPTSQMLSHRRLQQHRQLLDKDEEETEVNPSADRSFDSFDGPTRAFHRTAGQHQRYWILRSVEIISLIGLVLLHVLGLTVSVGYVYFQKQEGKDFVERNGDVLYLPLAAGLGSFVGLVLFRHRVVIMCLSTTTLTLFTMILRLTSLFAEINSYYDTMRIALVMVFTLMVVVSSIITSHRVSMDRRRRFERDLRGRLVANILAAKEKMVRSTLNILLPDQVFQEIVKGRMIRDSSPSCTIIVSRVADYPVWASWFLPMYASSLLEQLFEVFDMRAQEFGCFKISQSDEYYICSAGLRNTATTTKEVEGPPPEEGGESREMAASTRSSRAEALRKAPFRFGELQIKLAKAYSVKVRRLMHRATPIQDSALRLCVGVHKGSATGTFVGTRQLSYAMGGPAPAGALALCHVAPPGTILATSTVIEDVPGYCVEKQPQLMEACHALSSELREVDWGLLKMSTASISFSGSVRWALTSVDSIDTLVRRADDNSPQVSIRHAGPSEAAVPVLHDIADNNDSVNNNVDDALPLNPFSPPAGLARVSSMLSESSAQSATSTQSPQKQASSAQSELRLRYLESEVKRRRNEATDQGTRILTGASVEGEEYDITISHPKLEVDKTAESPENGTSDTGEKGTQEADEEDPPFGRKSAGEKLHGGGCCRFTQTFSSERLERAFWASQSYVGRRRPDPFGRPRQPWHQMHYFVLCVVLLTFTTMENAQTPACFILQMLSFVVITTTGICGFIWPLPVHVYLVAESIVGLLIPIALRLGGPSLFNGNVLPAYMHIGFATVSSFRLPARWLIVSLKILSFPAVDLTLMGLGVGGVSKNTSLGLSNAAIYIPISILLVIGAWFTEREARKNFLVQRKLEKAQHAFDIAAHQQRVLLTMLLPTLVVERVTIGNKARLLDKTFVMEFPDYLLMELKCSPIAGDESGAATFDRWERMFCCLEAAFDRHLVTALVGVLHVLGDTVRLGGPMLVPESNAPDNNIGFSNASAKSVLSRAIKSLFSRYGRREESESMAQTAAVGLLMTLAELVRSGEFKGLTALLVAESGIATVVGTPPSFTVVGVVSRLASAIAAAAPPPRGDRNPLLMSKKFEALLNQGLEKVRRIPQVGASASPAPAALQPDADKPILSTHHENRAVVDMSPPALPPPFSRGPLETWRLRGAGYVDVTHLIVK